MRKSRLCIATYNATTYLDSLFWNIPTIAFWKPQHWELNDQAEPYFKLLIKAEILHLTPESAAQQMIKVWDDVDGWWQSDTVQRARERFCEQYSDVGESLVIDLAGLMKNISSSSV